jgi:hypothetical protein
MNSQPAASVVPALGQVNSPSLSDCEETTILCLSVRERTADMAAQCHPISVAIASFLLWRRYNDRQPHAVCRPSLILL